jgi:hypothetical protein
MADDLKTVLDELAVVLGPEFGESGVGWGALLIPLDVLERTQLEDLDPEVAKKVSALHRVLHQMLVADGKIHAGADVARGLIDWLRARVPKTASERQLFLVASHYPGGPPRPPRPAGPRVKVGNAVYHPALVPGRVIVTNGSATMAASASGIGLGVGSAWPSGPGIAIAVVDNAGVGGMAFTTDPSSGTVFPR